MKKLLSTILSIIILAALVVGGSQEPDGGPVLPWTIVCLVIIFLAGLAIRSLEKKQVRK